MAAVQKLTKQAWDVFRHCFTGKSISNDSLNQIKVSLTKITASDLNISITDQNGDDGNRTGVSGDASATIEASSGSGDYYHRAGAPVGYTHIFEDGVMTMGVFIIREGGRIPLHNHPGMYGLLKVLYGNIKIRTFNTISEDLAATLPIPKFEGFPDYEPPQPYLLVPTRLGVDDKHLTASSEAVVLTPHEGNHHSLESVGGSAAFLDILAPPYDPVIGRDCYYFRELTRMKSPSSASDRSGDDYDVKWLMRISQPRDFWCDEVDYQGPEVSINVE